LKTLLRQTEPAALVTEWLPGITEELIRLGFSAIIADTDETYPNTFSIDVDDWGVGREAARYFMQSGHKHFACVHNNLPYGEQRLGGFSQELRRNGHECHTLLPSVGKTTFYLEHWSEPSRDIQDWLQQLPKPVGIFAVHDPLGRWLCECCRLFDVAVPEEVSVVGANNDPLVCELSYPPLASVHIPWGQIGGKIGKVIESLLQKGGPLSGKTRITSGPVVPRQSASLIAVDDETVRRVLRYMQEYYSEAITISSICSKLRVSRRTVERKFSEFLHCSPHEKLQCLRIDCAKRFLLETNLPVGRIAERSGFSDPERFAVVFRESTGSSPSRFRKKSFGPG